MTRFEDLQLGRERVVLTAPAWVKWVLLPCYLAYVGWLAPVVRDLWRSDAGLPGLGWLAVGGALLGLVAVVQPRFWGPWVQFAADHRGAYFPDGTGRWHRVPWERIHEVTVERRRNGTGLGRHVVVYARLTDEERRRLAPASRLLATLLGHPPARNQPVGLVLNNNFGNLDANRARIDSLRQYGVAHQLRVR